MGTFSAPFVQESEPAAIRAFGDAVNDPQRGEMWYKHPEDFALYLVGEFDRQNGGLSPVMLRCLVTASALASGRMLDYTPVVNGVEKVGAL
jgi:hypothetical protein